MFQMGVSASLLLIPASCWYALWKAARDNNGDWIHSTSVELYFKPHSAAATESSWKTKSWTGAFCCSTSQNKNNLPPKLSYAYDIINEIEIQAIFPNMHLLWAWWDLIGNVFKYLQNKISTFQYHRSINFLKCLACLYPVYRCYSHTGECSITGYFWL